MWHCWNSSPIPSSLHDGGGTSHPVCVYMCCVLAAPQLICTHPVMGPPPLVIAPRLGHGWVVVSLKVEIELFVGVCATSAGSWPIRL